MPQRAQSAPATPHPGIAAAPPRPARVASLIALFAATCTTFAGALRNGWLRWDDPDYVTDVPSIARGLTWHGVLHFLHEPLGANWLPLTAVSHMLDVSIFGLAPAGHHATSVLLHAVNAVLLALVLARFTGAWWRSMLVAAVWALHPLRVESVAWIAERKDVLSGTCFLLVLWAYAAWVRRPGPSRFAWVGLGLACGLLAKPMLVTVPFLLVVLDVAVFGRLAARGVRTAAPAAKGPGRSAPARSLAGLLAEKWVLLAMVAVVAIVTWRVQSGIGATAGSAAVPLARRLANAALSCWRYVGLTLWPRHLVVFHPLPADPQFGRALLAGAAVLAVGVVAVAGWRRRPYLALGWCWYLGMLVPVVGLVQVGSQAYADRYTYLPGIGLAIALVGAAADACGRSRAGRVALGAAGIVACASLATLAARHVPVWHDTESLFTPVLTAPDANLVSVNLAHRTIGWALLREGRVADARPHLEAAQGLPPGWELRARGEVASRPRDAEARRALAAGLAREQRIEDAVAEYDSLLASAPDDLDALVNVAWIRATHELAAHRDARVAVRDAERARDHCPEPQAVVFSTLAAAYAEAGRFADAVRAGERALALARAAGDGPGAEQYERQLRHYRAGRPFHFED